MSPGDWFASGWRVAVLLGAGGLLAALPGCAGDMSEALGTARVAPDEFSVTTRAPLAMPPDESLPKPRPGAPRPQEQSEREQALEAIAPDVALRGDGGGSSAGQAALLGTVAAAAARPAPAGEIRGGVGVAGELAFWRGRSSDLLVDADAENRRLREAAASGEAPTAGATRATASN